MRWLLGAHERLRRELAASQHRTVPSGPNFSLFSVVEQSLTKSVSRDRIGSLTPADHAVPGSFREYTVEVKLTAITLPQVVDSLYGMQSVAIPMTVSNLAIRPHASNTHSHASNTHSYEVDMTGMGLRQELNY